MTNGFTVVPTTSEEVEQYRRTHNGKFPMSSGVSRVACDRCGVRVWGNRISTDRHRRWHDQKDKGRTDMTTTNELRQHIITSVVNGQTFYADMTLTGDILRLRVRKANTYNPNTYWMEVELVGGYRPTVTLPNTGGTVSVDEAQNFARLATAAADYAYTIDYLIDMGASPSMIFDALVKGEGRRRA